VVGGVLRIRITDADPDPYFQFDADPDPACHHFDSDPDPSFHFDADPDPTVTLMRIQIGEPLRNHQIRIGVKIWIRIRIETNANLKHLYFYTNSEERDKLFGLKEVYV
jgi:hypothetical protein